MADRVKYFLLGVLFLVVAGVIAYDRWNSAGEPASMAGADAADSGEEVEVAVDRQRPRPVDPALTVDPVDAGSGRPPADQRPLVDLPNLPDGDRGPRSDTPAPGPTPQPAPLPPAPKPEPVTAPPPAPAKTHVVRKGENLETIAMHYYGTRSGVQWIVQANRLDNPNRIAVNQKLVIPARKETPAAKPGATAAGATSKTSGPIPSRYTVKAGDGNLYAICRRIYGSDGVGARVARVMDMNHLWSAEVQPGTILILPPR